MPIRKYVRAAILSMMLLCSSAFADVSGTASSQSIEIQQLKNKVIELNNTPTPPIESELRNNNRLARYQAALLIKVFSYEIYLKLKKQGYNRSISKIEKHVRAAYDCSWVFTDLGPDHMARFEQILKWGKDESGFNDSLISKWKAGTYIKRLNKMVNEDTVDYGSWQINQCHKDNIKLLNVLYEGGVINFKIKKIRELKDVMDIPTNCAARCMIESDRKARGWDWQHTGDKDFAKFLQSVAMKLEKEGLYNKDFGEKYYNIIPIKPYQQQSFFIKM